MKRRSRNRRVETGLSDKLPDEYRFAHTLSFLLHDIILEVLVAGNESGIFGINLFFRDDSERASFESFEGDTIAWLISQGRKGELGALLERMVFAGLLSDFCHFVYEALTCSRKGQAHRRFRAS